MMTVTTPTAPSMPTAREFGIVRYFVFADGYGFIKTDSKGLPMNDG